LTADAVASADRPSFEGWLFAHNNQATGLVQCTGSAPTSPLRDSAGISPDFAEGCAARRLRRACL